MIFSIKNFSTFFVHAMSIGNFLKDFLLFDIFCRDQYLPTTTPEHNAVAIKPKPKPIMPDWSRFL